MAWWEGREIWYVGQAGQIHGSNGLVDHEQKTGRKLFVTLSSLKRMDLVSILGGLIKEDDVCIS